MLAWVTRKVVFGWPRDRVGAMLSEARTPWVGSMSGEARPVES